MPRYWQGVFRAIFQLSLALAELLWAFACLHLEEVAFLRLFMLYAPYLQFFSSELAMAPFSPLGGGLCFQPSLIAAALPQSHCQRGHNTSRWSNLLTCEVACRCIWLFFWDFFSPALTR